MIIYFALSISATVNLVMRMYLLFHECEFTYTCKKFVMCASALFKTVYIISVEHQSTWWCSSLQIHRSEDLWSDPGRTHKCQRGWRSLVNKVAFYYYLNSCNVLCKLAYSTFSFTWRVWARSSNTFTDFNCYWLIQTRKKLLLSDINTVQRTLSVAAHLEKCNIGKSSHPSLRELRNWVGN